MKICNRAHVCVKAKGCSHARPHDGNCGPAMPCYDDPSGEISMCVDVIDNKYKTYSSKTCKCCGGKGRFEEEHIHKVS